MAIYNPDEMTKNKVKSREISSYPPAYLKEKALKYTSDTGVTMSVFIADLLRGFFADPSKNKVAQ